MTTIPIENQGELDFVLMLRRRWADVLYPRLCAEYAQLTADSRAADAQSVAERVHRLNAYGPFAWLERGSQKMLWRAALAAIAASPEDALSPRGHAGCSSVELDPHLELPAWYTDWDIHVQPGGVWSSTVAAEVYELGAKIVMQGENDDYRFHRLFVETAIPTRRYGRIVDLGCGFGKSTWFLKVHYPEAEVIGVDLAEPCLRLAARRADAKGLQIRFRQANATATGLETHSAELVTATMLIHELPLEVLAAVFKEAVRLLAPGGLVRILDFQFTGDPLRDLAMREHGRRNNEPFLPPMMSADIIAMARAAGLHNPRWTAFDERSTGRLATLRWPERPEWHFPWAVLEAERLP
jgi:ubiquinone/menaquinone biosynthesis C-methylase UbiE